MDSIKEDGFNLFFNWHFIDTPFMPFTDTNPTFDKYIDNSVTVITNVLQVLNNPNPYNIFFKLFSVRLLTHIIGDMHQPLHNMNMYSQQFKSGDQGGNLIEIQVKVDRNKIK